MANCRVCNADIDLDFGSSPQSRMVGDHDGLVCSAKCEADYNRGIEHAAPQSYGTRCNGCGRNIERMSGKVYSLDYDPYCSDSCKRDYERRLSTSWM